MDEFKKEDKYLVLKLSDIDETLDTIDKLELEVFTENIANKRMDKGKERIPKYIVVKDDEPYAEQVWELIRKGCS